MCSFFLRHTQQFPLFAKTRKLFADDVPVVGFGACVGCHLCSCCQGGRADRQLPHARGALRHRHGPLLGSLPPLPSVLCPLSEPVSPGMLRGVLSCSTRLLRILVGGYPYILLDRANVFVLAFCSKNLPHFWHDFAKPCILGPFFRP